MSVEITAVVINSETGNPAFEEGFGHSFSQQRVGHSSARSGIRNTVGHLENRLTTVRRYWHPLEGGRGPTMSQFKWENLADRRGKASRLLFTWWWTFDCWQLKHARVHFVTSCRKSFQMKRLRIRSTLAFTPG
ncbi:hypothetical protein TNCT_304481 [Trichonephila clavata]|uniref:Uncharacterized protein n=1 Tax=Trichonephila clavata TaxID=2740835 RepID=A0A8X6K2W2_TRICU|nr:hypothetical protein TNCT_304481 [Trichonephila clavata]